MSTPLRQTLIARPRRLRRVCVAMAILIVVAFTAIGILLKRSSAGTAFHTSDQIAMIGLGLLIAAGVLLVARPSVSADAEGIHIRNIVVSHDLRWQVVTAVRFYDGAPWASLDLHDDETVAVMAIQAVDKERAVEAVRGLRELFERSKNGALPPTAG